MAGGRASPAFGPSDPKLLGAAVSEQQQKVIDKFSALYQRRQELKAQLYSHENRLYAMEKSYLQNYKPHGSIYFGYRATPITEAEHTQLVSVQKKLAWFAKSSATWSFQLKTAQAQQIQRQQQLRHRFNNQKMQQQQQQQQQQHFALSDQMAGPNGEHLQGAAPPVSAMVSPQHVQMRSQARTSDAAPVSVPSAQTPLQTGPLRGMPPAGWSVPSGVGGRADRYSMSTQSSSYGRAAPYPLPSSPQRPRSTSGLMMRGAHGSGNGSGLSMLPQRLDGQGLRISSDGSLLSHHSSGMGEPTFREHAVHSPGALSVPQGHIPLSATQPPAPSGGARHMHSPLGQGNGGSQGIGITDGLGNFHRQPHFGA